MMKLRQPLAAVFVLTLALCLPSEAVAQICIGNSAEQPKLSSVTLSTGGVDLPHDMGLHMAGVRHVTGGGLLGVASSVYGVQYGALTGLPNSDDYDMHAYRGDSRLVFGLPVPSQLVGPGALGACVSVGFRLSAYGYLLKLEAIDDPNQEVSGWHFSGALPVTVDLGYEIPLGDGLAVTPYIAPGISPFFGGLIHESTVGSGDDSLPSGTDFFTNAGVGLNHDMFRVGLVLQTGLMEYAGRTRLGLEAGIRW